MKKVFFLLLAVLMISTVFVSCDHVGVVKIKVFQSDGGVEISKMDVTSQEVVELKEGKRYLRAIPYKLNGVPIIGDSKLPFEYEITPEHTDTLKVKIDKYSLEIFLLGSAVGEKTFALKIKYPHASTITKTLKTKGQ